VPAPLRRLAASARRRHAERAAAAGPAGVGPGEEAIGPSGLAATRPETFAYLREVVATSPLVAEGLGETFARDLRAGLDRGDGEAVDRALVLAAPVSLAQDAAR
jgi:hypothetical protein